MENVHAKVAAWYKLYAVKKDYEFRVRRAREHEAGDAPLCGQLEAEMKAVAAQVDKAFREASEAVYGNRGDNRPSAH